MIGKIITFYSYKGGVGRSMALANAGVLMAKWGYKVLMLDWDFEAPGLEFYFKSYINHEDLKEKPGIIDLLEGQRKAELLDWKECVLKIDIDNLSDKLSMITSGKKVDNYFDKVKNFDFNEFYKEKSGGRFIENIRGEWKKTYDFILVDSRTGISDTGGVCTVQLPEILVLLFTATKQGLEGIVRVGENANSALAQLPIDRNNILILPVPSRFEFDKEREKGIEWLKDISDKTSKLIELWFPEEKFTSEFIYEFFNKIFLPHSAYYSFGENLPVMEGAAETGGLADKYSYLTSLLCRDLIDIEKFLEGSEQYVQETTKEQFLEQQDAVILKEYNDYLIKYFYKIGTYNNIELGIDHFYLIPKFKIIISTPDTNIDSTDSIDKKLAFERRESRSTERSVKKTPDFIDYFLDFPKTKFIINGNEIDNNVNYFNTLLSYVVNQKYAVLDPKFIRLRKSLNDKKIRGVFNLDYVKFLSRYKENDDIIDAVINTHLELIDYYNNDIKQSLKRLIEKNDDENRYLFIFQVYEKLDAPLNDELFIIFEKLKERSIKLFESNIVILAGNNIDFTGEDNLKKIKGYNDFTKLEISDIEDDQKQDFIVSLSHDDKLVKSKKESLPALKKAVKQNIPENLFKYFSFESEIYKAITSKDFSNISKAEYEFISALSFYLIKNNTTLFSDEILIKIRNSDDIFNKINLPAIKINHAIIKHYGRDIESKNFTFAFSDEVREYLAGNAIAAEINNGKVNTKEAFLFHLLDEIEEVKFIVPDEEINILCIKQKWFKIISFAFSCLETQKLNSFLSNIILNISTEKTERNKAKIVFLTNLAVMYLPNIESKIAEDIIKLFIQNLNSKTDLKSTSGELLSINDEVDELLRKSELWSNYYEQQLLCRLSEESKEVIDNEKLSQKHVIVYSLCKIYSKRFKNNPTLRDYLETYKLRYANNLQRIQYCLILLNTAFEESHLEKESKLILTGLELENYDIVKNLFQLFNNKNAAVSTTAAWTLGWLSAARDNDTYGIWKPNEQQIEELIILITSDNSKISGYATWWIYHILSIDYQKWDYPDGESDLIYKWAGELDNKIKELNDVKANSFLSDILIKKNSNLCYQVKGKDTTGRIAWYFILVDKDKKEEFLEHRSGSSYDLADYGKIIASGYGEEVPEDIKEMLQKQYGFDNFLN